MATYKQLKGGVVFLEVTLDSGARFFDKFLPHIVLANFVWRGLFDSLQALPQSLADLHYCIRKFPTEMLNLILKNLHQSDSMLI